ncbi:MAG TPA: hypothetical protein VFZ77_07960 [Acidimicrobiales bacterium]
MADAHEPLTIGPTDRLRLRPCATRRLGTDLLVSIDGAAGPVERLTGLGPELWSYFGAGFTVAEAAARVAERAGTPAASVESHVLDYAEALVRAGMAEREP